MKILNVLSSGYVGGIEQLCFTIGKHATYGNAFCFMFAEGKIYDEMVQYGLNVISLAGLSKRKISHKRWAELCSIVKNYEIVVVHHWSLAIQYYFVKLARKFPCKKFVLTIHSCFDPQHNLNYGSALKNAFAKFSIRNALHVADKIIFVSEAGRTSYVNNFKLDYSKTAVVYNGIETNVIKDSVKHSDEWYRIIYIGRLAEIKGVQFLIESIQRLKQDGYSISLKIIGDGPYRGNLEKLTENLNMKDCVKFLGIKRDIGKYLSGSDIFVYPSIWQEVFGISIVEAMSYGIPCVANNVGGIPEIIEPGVNGYLTDTMDANGIYHAIKKLLDEENIDVMKKSCLETAKKFSIEKTVDRLETIYSHLLSNKK